MEIVFELQPQFYQCQIPKGQNAKKGVFSLEIMCLFVQHRNIKLYIYQQLQLLIDISSGTSIRSDSKQFSEKKAQEQKNTFDENEKYFFFDIVNIVNIQSSSDITMVNRAIQRIWDDKCTKLQM